MISDDRMPDAARAASQVEAILLRSLLQSSGAFRGVAGSSVQGDLFIEALADELARSSPLGLANQLPGATDRSPMSAASSIAPAATAITSGFGARTDPLDHAPRHHDGIDIAAPEGSPICAPWDGTVVRTGNNAAYGEFVEVAHARRVTTVYAHAQKVLVNEGDRVKAGEVIGLVGSSGRATGPHVHLETRVDGGPTDPLPSLIKAQR